MFTNMGVHIIESKPGCHIYVGSIPAILGETVKATTADIMGGRAWTDKTTGETVTIKFPRFDTRQAAVDFAESKGVSVK